MDFETLHATSLRLVGRNPLSASSPTKHVDCAGGSESDIPDTAMLLLQRPQFDSQRSYPYCSNRTMEKAPKQKSKIKTVADTVSMVSGPDEERWRRHGGARRLQLLEEDRLKGGQDFTLSFDCSVQRYFQVARWALEQFHQLYQSDMNLEETYVMGNRIVTFLTDCLPQHPGLFRSPEVRDRTRIELEHLQECLEDLALRIDEEECNHFVANFDPASMDIDDDDDDALTEDSTVEDEDEDEDSVGVRGDKIISTPPKGGSDFSLIGNDAKKGRVVHFEDWVAFPKSDSGDIDTVLDDRKAADSPTAETVGTTGTGSIEPLDTSYISSSSDEYRMESRKSMDLQTNAGKNNTARSPYYVADSGDDRPYDGEDEKGLFSSSRELYPIHVRLDFLDKIANEEVEYETDSEAADSWAPSDGESLCRIYAASSSADAPTCDPARIAFRNLMKRLPQTTSSLSDVGNRGHSNCPSPTFLDILNKSVGNRIGNTSVAQGHVVGDCHRTLDTEQRVESEIQQYLESEEDDAETFIATCHKKLSTNNSPSLSILGGGENESNSSSICRRGVLPSSDSSFTRYSSFNKPSASSEPVEESRPSAFCPFDDDDDDKQGGLAPPSNTFVSLQDNFLDDDTWVPFDNSQSRVPVNFFAANK